MTDIVERLKDSTRNQHRRELDREGAAAEIERLREALAIYADPDNWTSESGLDMDPQDMFIKTTDYSYVTQGCQIARRALGLPEAD